MRQSRKVAAFLVIILFSGMVSYFTINYARHDPETSVLNDDVRRRATGSFVRLSNGITHYELQGPPTARTVVLVHGFSVPYYLWDHTFGPLVKAGFRVLRYDLYGRGFSDRPNLRYDADLYDRQLAELLSALRIQRPVDLVGASMGGPIGVTFAVRHPERVRSLALFDPAYLSGESLPWKLRAPLVGEYFMCVDLAPGLADGQKEDFIHPERYPDYFAGYSEQMKYRGFRRALLSTLRNYLARDDREEYVRVGQSHKPVLLIWGKGDKDVPFEVSREVLQATPQAEFHPLEDAGHVPFYEHPEIVNPVLIEFLGR